MSRIRFVQVASAFVIAAGSLLSPKDAIAEEEDAGCYAGGPGASSCEVEGSAGAGVKCSVTCVAGYACCKIVGGCKCVID